MFNDKLKNLSPYVGPLVISFILTFQFAWLPGFFHDGYLYAALGKHAVLNGDWLIPHLSKGIYNEFFHHIPFVFVLEGLFFKLFGASYLSARFFNGIFLFGTYALVIKLLNKEVKWSYFSILLLALLPPIMKKSRFPALDFPLMFFFMLTTCNYFKAITLDSNKYWVFSGISLGFVFLTKGPIGIFLALALFIYLVVSKKLNRLMTPIPWVSFVLSLTVFSIWPVLLQLEGRFDIFLKWFEFTFLHTIKEGRGAGSPSYTYILFLLKQALIWVILFMIALKKNYFKSELVKLSSIITVVFIFGMSCAKFKYSHYLIPIYPMLCIVAASNFQRISDSKFLKFQSVFKGLALLLAIVLLTFPLTNISKRDQSIFKAREILSQKNIKPISWYILNESYPFWSLANLTAWEDSRSTYLVTFEKLESKVVRNSILLVAKRDLDNLKRESFFKKIRLIHHDVRKELYFFHTK